MFLSQSLSLLVLAGLPSLVVGASISSNLPKPWTSKGCYTEGSGIRALSGSSYSNSSVTEEQCIGYCNNNGYIYAGVEYGNECYCGNTFNSGSTNTTSTDCNMPCAGNSSEYCGAGNRLNVFWSGQTPPAPPIVDPGVGKWKSLGCYTDNVNGRTLPYGVLTTGGASNMTIALCISACNATGYTYAGAEYAGECFCGNSIANGGALVTDGCNMVCNGNVSEYCGGSNRLDVYQLNGASSSSSSSSSSAPSSTSSSSSSASGVGSSSSASGSSSVASSTSSSRASGSTSVTSSTSSTSVASSTPSSTSAAPTSTSTSAASSTPSSTSASSTVNAPASTSTSSSTTSVRSSTSSSTSASPTSTLCPATNGTTLTDSNGQGYTIHCASDSTVNSYAAVQASASYTECMAACDASTGCNGWVYVGGNNGVGYGNCYLKTSMGSYISTGTNYIAGVKAASGSSSSGSGSTSASSTASGTSSGSSSASGSTSTSRTGTTTSSASGTTTIPPSGTGTQSDGNTSVLSGSTTISSSTSLSLAPTATGLPHGWSYKGCYIDNANGGRVLASQNADNSSMTVESCTNACNNAGYQIAGIEYSTQCYCGNQIIEGGALASSDSQCNMACGGDKTETCGAGNRLSVYSNSTITVLAPPATQNSTGDWKYLGCYTDNVNNGAHSLPWQIILPNNNSASTCLGLCAQYGYPVGGMEYGEECYCGDPADIVSGGSVLSTESSCSTVCSGNASYFCGGGNRLSLYQWNGKNPLYSFSYPTGNNAGAYTYFTPGVVVPLITVPGINGKITFVEKYGTSSFGNSTGAYELDPSLVGTTGNWSDAWRQMTGIKTDVFCSAGLILPDAGARQINIGGWSGTSTYGVRFYTPDGSPGKKSVNEWEENAAEIALQAGRWYPSAMTMTNGSILVVGGEDGSNGNPTPSLELLPKAGGTVYCDWLETSDPYNLYPFLAVLPGGGIFVAYWNQARILDAGSFDTTKTLPMIPGAVSNNVSGRTYPFEGTSVLLPQTAPYSDPLTVLICGGSGPGAGLALDNCASIQPEASNATWTLERMPSKRVMSCMVALPDGTYLILNGAHQGVAGFGLATSPNLNALLYDPTKPIGARMSVMANTTIARLYHSEAVLMDDGRVLVSGSDPEDATNPEEFRVEIFSPPYILAGNSRPTFSVANATARSLSYGQSITFPVTIPSGSGGNVRVSMLGAVASTHGNSMGQRTLFPAASCSASSCTVTMPPNINIAPPGWFQMFVLDGATPSKAQWVRLGGDPGSLGEWPTAAGFTQPGS